ncbi:multidrug ABC transporter ATP-binding protein [Rhizocola hellebori]|uniref:Multidrug ABC transporter ATP-binding protein n=1 Tax=Rhizocola hellebori TaxID=1392758 RepID=A0A8J3VMB3_9ACTN|nr:multidrug ABC transporter ATP-binding protein [Rhizocola hellebori]
MRLGGSDFPEIARILRRARRPRGSGVRDAAKPDEGGAAAVKAGPGQGDASASKESKGGKGGGVAVSREVLGRGARLIGRAVRGEPWLFAVSFGGACLVVLLTIGGAFVIGAVVADVIVPALDRREFEVSAVAGAAAALVGLSLLRVAGIFARRLGSVTMQQRLQAKTRKVLVRRYLSLPMAWHQQQSTGTLLSHAGSDVDASWSPAASLAYAAATVVLLVAAMTALLTIDWALAAIGLVAFPLLFTIFAFYSRAVAPRYRRAQQLRGEVSALAHESFDGALVVKAMGREAFETQRFRAKVDELRDCLIAIGRIRGRADPVIDSIPSIATLTVLVVGAWRLRAGAVDLGELTTAAFLFALLDMPVRAIGWLLTALPRAVAGSERVDKVLAAKGDMRYGSSTVDPGPADLRISRLTFRYPGREPVLHKVSLHLAAGTLVALVGETGSGKSTLIALAARLVDPESGTVKLNGINLRMLGAQPLAGAVALVPQLSFAFDDTVRVNVALGREGIDDHRIWEALRQAQADEFVTKLPDGLDTVLGERGVVLSGGQRQRITLARAIAGRPGLLLLDDATSAVDPAVESAILDRLRGELSRTSVLAVATRRAAAERADRVIYLEHGRVKAAGAHEELLAHIPRYAELMHTYDRAVP